MNNPMWETVHWNTSYQEIIFTAVLLFACKEAELPYVTAEPNMQAEEVVYSPPSFLSVKSLSAALHSLLRAV